MRGVLIDDDDAVRSLGGRYRCRACARAAAEETPSSDAAPDFPAARASARGR